MNSEVSIVLSARDLFSTLQPAVENLIEHVDPRVPIHAVIGGAPEALRRSWLRAFEGRVTFQFEDRFLYQAEARNLGLQKVATPLAVVMDIDVFVRPGWLDALLECQRETGAMMVVPLVLERPRAIHCAGNDLYVTTEGGVSYGHKVLRFWRFPYAEGCNLERRPTDYGELHCQLLQVEPTLRLGALDWETREVGEVDSAMTWRQAGGDLWFEPRSVVHFVEDAPLREADIRFFAWHWDMRELYAGFRFFEEKWGFDISEHGEVREFLYRRNARLGWLPRNFPSELSLRISHALWRWGWKVRRLFMLPDDAATALRKRQLGYDVWPKLPASIENERQVGHPALRDPPLES